MSGGEAGDDLPLGVLARAVFLEWEKLRPLYVVLVGAFTVLCLAAFDHLDLQHLVPVAVGGIFANVCYFAGPLMEMYVRWLGLRGVWPRWTLFAAGTLLTMLLSLPVTLTPLF